METFVFSTHIRMGSNILTTESNEITFEVINKSPHSKFVKGVGYFDIALLETQFIPLSDFIRPICLPLRIYDDFEEEYDGNTVELIGWGTSNALGKISDNLKRVSIAVVPFR